MNAKSKDKPWGIELNSFCMLMHLSLLSGLLIPGAGLVLPIIMWATNKDQFPDVDAHGKKILNWMISALIYGAISAVLVFLIIGFFGLMAVGICTLVFAIMGAVKANEGELWDYPLSIKFFKD